MTHDPSHEPLGRPRLSIDRGGRLRGPIKALIGSQLIHAAVFTLGSPQSFLLSLPCSMSHALSAPTPAVSAPVRVRT